MSEISNSGLVGNSLIVKVIEEKLTEINNGIPVSLELSARNNNYAYTGNDEFFVKVSTISDKQPLEREISFVSKFGANGDTSIPTFELLSSDVHEVVQPFMDTLTESFKNYYSIWKLEKGITGFANTKDGKTSPELLNAGYGFDRPIFDVMTEQLTKFHQLPTEGFNTYNYEMLNHKVSRRLDYMDAIRPDHISWRNAERLKELKEIIVTPEMMSFDNMVLCHSDSHLGNFVVTENFPNGVWIDFESVSVAPKELDLSPISLFYKHYLKDMKAWEYFVDCFNKHSVTAGNGEVNHDVLNRIELIKAYSGTTFLVLEDDKSELLDERLSLIEASLPTMTLQGYSY